jgi:hypothetical protein
MQLPLCFSLNHLTRLPPSPSLPFCCCSSGRMHQLRRRLFFLALNPRRQPPPPLPQLLQGVLRQVQRLPGNGRTRPQHSRCTHPPLPLVSSLQPLYFISHAASVRVCQQCHSAITKVSYRVTAVPRASVAAAMQARVTLSDFDCICILGHGGFGKVCSHCLCALCHQLPFDVCIRCCRFSSRAPARCSP